MFVITSNLDTVWNGSQMDSYLIAVKYSCFIIETEDKENGLKEQKKTEAPPGAKMEKRASKAINKYVSIL